MIDTTPVQAPAAQRAYLALKQAILGREFPGGAMLSEGELAERVGVSRTPVREALLRLQAEGLLRLYPKKGALVLAVSAAEIADVLATRELIEEHTAVLALRQGLPGTSLQQQLDQMSAAADAGDVAGFIRTDRLFHRVLVEAAGNAILTELYDAMRDRQLRMGAVLTPGGQRMQQTLVEHRRILTAVRQRDEAALLVAVHEHLEHTRSTLSGIGL